MPLPVVREWIADVRRPKPPLAAPGSALCLLYLLAMGDCGAVQIDASSTCRSANIANTVQVPASQERAETPDCALLDPHVVAMLSLNAEQLDLWRRYANGHETVIGQPGTADRHPQPVAAKAPGEIADVGDVADRTLAALLATLDAPQRRRLAEAIRQRQDAEDNLRQLIIRHSLTL